MNQVIELLKIRDYQIPRELLFNYKNINISDSELIILIYLINQESRVFNPKKISNDLNFKLNDVLELTSSLTDKNIINIEMDKLNNKRTEIINLDALYEKLGFSLNEISQEDNNNLYSMFEEEFGRTLSPMEYEIISCWKDNGCSEEMISLALKEAVYNGVSNLRYIDKIIHEWNKKGIKTIEDVEKDRKAFKTKQENNEKLFDYDWLNDNNN